MEAMKRIRYDAGKNRRDFSIIALTANALSTAREMFIAEGFDGFVSKPIELIELERVIKKVLPKSLITYEYIGTGYAPDIEEKTVEEKIDPDAVLSSAGINIESGVGYCAGDREFYNSVISEYAGEALDKKNKLEKFLADKDMKNYAIAVHAIKSTSLRSCFAF